MTLLAREKKILDGSKNIFARYVVDVSGITAGGWDYSADNYAQLLIDAPPSITTENKIGMVTNSTGEYLSSIITFWTPAQYQYPAGLYIVRETSPAVYEWVLLQKQSERSFISNILKNTTSAEWTTLYNQGQQIPQYATIKYENINYFHITPNITSEPPDLDHTNWISVVDLDINKPTPTYKEGRLFYDNTKKTVSYYNDEEEVLVNLGQEVLIRVCNKSGATIPNGSVVYPTGEDVVLDCITVELADASIKEKCRLIGVVTHDIEDNTTGYVTKFGDIGSMNTTGLTGVVYLSATTPGAITNTKPDDGGFVTTVGFIRKEDAVNGILVVDPNVSELTVEVTDTNGFPSTERSNTDLSFANSTRTFTVSATSYPYHYYMLGDKYEKNALDTVIITDVEGRHYVYYDGDTLISIANPNLGQVDQIIRTKCLVASLYWNAADKQIEGPINDERHGISMSPDTHSYLHFTRGAQYLSGLGVGDISADDNTPNDASGQFSVSTGFTTDEDIITVYPTIGSTIGLPIYYLDGANGDARRILEPGFSVLTDTTAGTGGTGRLVYNEFTGTTWQLTTVGSGNYVLCHVFAVNGTGTSIGDESDDTIIAVIGQNEYNSSSDARLGATTEIGEIISGLAQNEIIPIATLIFETKDNFTGSSILSRVVSTADGDYTDWRTSEIQAGTGASSHTNLTNVDTAGTGIIQGHVNNNEPFQLPELTTTQRDAVASPNEGMKIFNTTTGRFNSYEGGQWIEESKNIAGDDKNIQFNSGGILTGDNDFAWDYINKRLGIGNSNPSTELVVGSATRLNRISTGTSDSADTKLLQLCGGGDGSAARGGYINLSGNEDLGTGSVDIVTGTATGAVTRFYTGSTTTLRWTIDANGKFVGGTNSPGADIEVLNTTSPAILSLSGGASGSDTGVQMADANRTWKLGVNVGGVGAGIFNIYDITGGGTRLNLNTVGRIYTTGGRQPTGTFHTAPTSTTDALFDALAPSIPNVGDKIVLTGTFEQEINTVVMNISFANRDSATQISLYGYDVLAANLNARAYVITDGGTVSIATSLAW